MPMVLLRRWRSSRRRWGQDHVGLTDVGAVGLFGQAEGEHFADLEPAAALRLASLALIQIGPRPRAVTWKGYQ